jgi:hypothetical protein
MKTLVAGQLLAYDIGTARDGRVALEMPRNGCYGLETERWRSLGLFFRAKLF